MRLRLRPCSSAAAPEASEACTCTVRKQDYSHDRHGKRGPGLYLACTITSGGQEQSSRLQDQFWHAEKEGAVMRCARKSSKGQTGGESTMGYGKTGKHTCEVLMIRSKTTGDTPMVSGVLGARPMRPAAQPSAGRASGGAEAACGPALDESSLTNRCRLCAVS